jgi:tRNA(fMet)-specific endonuclease VapC
MNFLYDTNIILGIIRSKKTNELTDFLNPLDKSVYISVVVEAELKSIALQKNWGKDKTDKLDYYLDRFSLIEVTKSIINTYSQIDSFSQHKNPNISEYEFDTPRNMGKNDLWIASTAALLGLELFTTDSDFLHLHKTFLEVRLIDQADLKKFF